MEYNSIDVASVYRCGHCKSLAPVSSVSLKVFKLLHWIFIFFGVLNTNLYLFRFMRSWHQFSSWMRVS
jgi:hypothetical protein